MLKVYVALQGCGSEPRNFYGQCQEGHSTNHKIFLCYLPNSTVLPALLGTLMPPNRKKPILISDLGIKRKQKSLGLYVSAICSMKTLIFPRHATLLPLYKLSFTKDQSISLSLRSLKNFFNLMAVYKSENIGSKQKQIKLKS